MKISEYAIKNYQFTLVIFLMIILLGATTILHMPRAEDPESHSPPFTIVVVYTGTSPKDIEDMVVNPMERKITALENIKRVKTTIKDGVAVVLVEYKYGSNVDDKYAELIREVNALRNTLPKDIASIEVGKIDPSDVNVIQIALVSENTSRNKLNEYAEKLRDELEQIQSLKKVEIHGLSDRIVRVDLELEKMAQMQLPLEVILGNVASEAANIPGGSVEAGNKSFNINTSGSYRNIEEIRNTVVYSANGKNILLQDVAKIEYDYAEEVHITRLNGYRSVFVTAAQKTGENISMTQKKYLPVIERFKSTLPPNINMIHHFDQANNVNKRIGSLGKDFLFAILLISITLLPLGQRAALIVMISIPLSLAIGIIMLDLLGFTLNQLSIVGLVVALGLLVDDSIVVVENIERWMRDGHSRLEATIKATKQIGLAVVGCTVTIVIAFMPLAFLPEAHGDFIRSLPMSVILCVVASMLVSLTIIPFLSSRILKDHIGHPDGNIFMRALKKIIHGSYAKLLDKALAKPILTIAIAFVLFVGSLWLFPVIGFSLFPASEKPQFLIEVTTPLQSNLTYTNKVTAQVEAELKKEKEIKYFATNVGKGNPRIYYNILPENERTDFAQIFVQLDEHTSPKRKLMLIEELRKKFSSTVEAEIKVKNFEQGAPIVAPVEVRIFGENLDTLRMIAAKVENLLETTPGAIYIENPVAHLKSDIKIDINKDKSRMLGIPTVTIDNTVRLGVTGIDAGKFSNQNGDEFKIVLTKSNKTTPR